MANQIAVEPGEVFHVEQPVYRELLIGCGTSRSKRLAIDKSKEQWNSLITLDIDEGVNPDVVHDLNVLPLPFRNEDFDEIHAYEVLEHIGTQGDWKVFFDQFAEFWRILKPGGLFYGTCPSWDSVHAWGDPGHTRVINESTITFLRQEAYDVENTPMTDYRGYWKRDFEVLVSMHQNEHYIFCLRKK
jgi:SAM-dependent methyltransferase